MPPLFAKRNLPVQNALDVLESLNYFVKAINVDLYSSYEQEAKERILRDIDDWPIVALSLTLDCPIWTEDKDFFGAGVATWTTDRVHIYLS
ncbi:putative nucleotide-binding protein [Xenococcus sp. PCC 7305]|nr:putative nucleotide-binding protein [Xenococcus sp. PCC 7305]